MQTIGSFKSTEDGGFTGTITTLVLSAKVSLVAAEKRSEKSPDFRILTANKREIGAAWKNTPKDSDPYLSLTFDDPTFPTPVIARLSQNASGDYALIWIRRKENKERDGED